MMTHLLWGADDTTPHQQYVLALDELTITRYIPFLYTTAQTHEALKAADTRNQLWIRVPGYNVFLFGQTFNDSRWKNIPLTEPMNRWMQDRLRRAADFYLTHKIHPNEAKFNRYRQPEEARS